MTQEEIIAQVVKESLQPYLDWTVKVAQDKLIEAGIYITNSDLLPYIELANAEVTTVNVDTGEVTTNTVE